MAIPKIAYIILAAFLALIVIPMALAMIYMFSAGNHPGTITTYPPSLKFNPNR